MKGTLRTLLATALALSLLLNAGLVQASGNDAGTEQEVLIVYKNDEGKEAVYDESVEVQHEFETIPVVSATVTNSDLRELLTDPNIARIERNVPVHITGDFKTEAMTVAPGERTDMQWGFNAIAPTVMWGKGYTGTNVKVAVIDSGISPHNDLTVAGGISTVDYTTEYIDDNGHGTHVAGIIAAHNNGSGIVGVAPDVELYAVKSMQQDGSGTVGDVIKGMEWAIQNNMDIINLSIGTPYDSTPFKEVCDLAYQQGIIVVASAGNEQDDENGVPKPVEDYTIGYPAKYDSVIAVAAVDQNNKRTDFSSTGAEVELAAPGFQIVSSYNTGVSKYSSMNGTSQAAPHITGMLSLLKQGNPGMSNVQLREEIRKYAVDLGTPGRDVEYGYGFVTFAKDLTAPADVTSLQVTSKNENSISIQWTNPADADFATNNIYANNVKVGTTETESYTLNNLQPGTPYAIAVKSVDQGGNESVGATIVETTDADVTAPAEVSNLTVVEKSATTAKIVWANPADSDFQRVNLLQNGMLVTNTMATEYEFTGLTPNTAYEFTVQTVDMLGNVSVGQKITVTTDNLPVVDTTPPAEVSGLAIGTVTITSAEVTWMNPGDPDFEKVNLYQDGNLVGDVSGNRYVFAGLTPSMTYMFTAKTVDTTGNESVGQSVWVTTNGLPPAVDTTPPAEVGNLVVSESTENSLTITWSNPADADFDHVEMYVDNQFVQNVRGTIYQATGLAPNTVHTFLVKTVDVNGNASAGRQILGMTTAVIPPTQPPVDNTAPAEVSNLMFVGATTTTAEVSWTNPADADFAKTYLYINGMKVLETTDMNHVFTGLAPNTAYFVEVKTVDTNGNVSAGQSIRIRTEQEIVTPTDPVDPIDPGIPTPPVDVTAPGEVSNLEVSDATPSTIRVRWVNPIDTDFAQANVYLNGSLITGTTNTFYEFVGLAADTAYTIVVKTVDASGNESVGAGIVTRTQTSVVTPPTDPSIPSQPPVEPPVVDTTAPAEVTGLVEEATTPNSITARWVNPVDADFAKVKLFVNDNYIGETSDTAFKFTGLVANTTYTIIVKTVDTTGNVSAGATLTAKTQAAPVVVTPPASGNPDSGHGDIVELPVNHYPSSSYSSSSSSSVIVSPNVLPAPVETPEIKQAVTAIEKAKKTKNIVDFVEAKTAIDSLSDEQKHEEFQVKLDTLKADLNIKDLPSKSNLRAVAVGISLQVAMKSEDYKFIDVSSIKTEGESQNIFVLNSKGERVDNVEIKVLFNRLVVMPKNGEKLASKETYTLIIDATVKGKRSLDAVETFELKNPLIFEFTTR